MAYLILSFDITSASIATLISSSVATIVSVLVNRTNGRKSLNDQLDSIVRISIEYPYLENPVFTNTWNENKNSTEERYLRYENYCTLVFNYLERLCKFYGFNKRKIEQHLNVKSWIRNHVQCWQNPSEPFENSDGYDKRFKKIVNTYLQ